MQLEYELDYTEQGKNRQHGGGGGGGYYDNYHGSHGGSNHYNDGYVEYGTWVKQALVIHYCNIVSRCYVVAMFNMQHIALNLIFCTGPEGLNDTWHFEK